MAAETGVCLLSLCPTSSPKQAWGQTSTLPLTTPCLPLPLFLLVCLSVFLCIFVSLCLSVCPCVCLSLCRPLTLALSFSFSLVIFVPKRICKFRETENRKYIIACKSSEYNKIRFANPCSYGLLVVEVLAGTLSAMRSISSSLSTSGSYSITQLSSGMIVQHRYARPSF